MSERLMPPRQWPCSCKGRVSTHAASQSGHWVLVVDSLGAAADATTATFSSNRSRTPHPLPVFAGLMN